MYSGSIEEGAPVSFWLNQPIIIILLVFVKKKKKKKIILINVDLECS